LTKASLAKDAGITLRAGLFGLALIGIDNYWITVVEVRWYSLDGTSLPLFVTPIFILFVIALLNLLARRLCPRLALRRGELLTIYIMMVTGATLASHDLIQNLFGTIGHPHYAANESNHYATMFYRYLPDRMFLNDKAALNGFYRGNTDPWVWNIIRFWLVPLAIWAGLVMTLIVMMLCVNIILRRQWTEHEKLVFPLVQLPIEMAAEDSGKRLYANKLMWVGFALAFSIGLINGLHALFPNFPYIQGIKAYDLVQYIDFPPWNVVGTDGNGVKAAAYPFAIGIAYFMPLDLSFSCWFFYVLRKLAMVAVRRWAIRRPAIRGSRTANRNHPARGLPWASS